MLNGNVIAGKLMYKAAVALLAAFFLMLLVIVLASESLLVIQRIAHVSEVQGKVEYLNRQNGQWASLAEGMVVKAGTRLRTDARGTATLTWSDGTKVKVGPDTILSVEKCFVKSGTSEEVSLFRLERGRVWTRVAKRLGQGAEFAVVTPVAVAGVRGTIFGVEARDGSAGPESIVSVYEGQVELQTTKGSKMVSSNEVAVVGKDGEVKLREQQPEEISGWLERKDLLLPMLVVTAPRNGEVVRNDSVAVGGRVETDARLTVNGAPAAPRPSGRFRVECKLRPGRNLIEVAAEDQSGRRTTHQIEVVYRPAD